jgi:hypothetical protein
MNVALVKAYLNEYDLLPIVVEFRKFEGSVKALNLSDDADMDKVLQATAAVQATGPSISFQDVSELLK